MQRIQAYRYRLNPNGEQLRKLEQYAGCCRFVYNKALAYCIETYKQREKYKGGYSLVNLLPQWKKESSWLIKVPALTLQQSIIDLDKAFKSFWRKGGYPKFKKKSGKASMRFPVAPLLNQRSIKLPKLGNIKYINSREIKGIIKSATVSKEVNHWFISILTSQNIDVPMHPSNSDIGIDVGITNFATLSDGTFIKPVSAFKRHHKRLALLQRRAAKKKKRSQNFKKAMNKVRKCYVKIKNTRNDFLHKLSTSLCKNHAIIFVEDLKISNMSKSAKGTIENPGTNIKAKSGLNRSILDQGWGEFRRQLQYKMDWLDGKVIAVPAHHTSQTCPNCQHCSKENRKSQSIFKCMSCGYTNNADIVGAMNIKERGHRLLACGESPDSVKQEPTR